jgi:alpha-L-arabinofuranosidase
LAASAVRDSNSGDIIVKIVNGANTPAPLKVGFQGFTMTKHFDLSSTVLTGPGPDAVNEPGKPPVITPVTERLPPVPTFDWEAPANSLTILRISRAASSTIQSTGTTQ